MTHLDKPIPPLAHQARRSFEDFLRVGLRGKVLEDGHGEQEVDGIPPGFLQHLLRPGRVGKHRPEVGEAATGKLPHALLQGGAGDVHADDVPEAPAQGAHVGTAAAAPVQGRP